MKSHDIARLRNAGFDAEHIAAVLGRPIGTVKGCLAKLAIPDPSPSEVRALMRQGLDTVDVARKLGTCFERQVWNALARDDNRRAEAA